MYVVQVATECSPVVQAGGLADVVYGLSRELEIRGHAVEIILPMYQSMRYDRIWDLCVTYDDLWVQWYGGAIRCIVHFGFVEGRKCFFVEPHSEHNFFRRPGTYGYGDDAMRFAFFSKAAMEFMLRANKRPDVIHCHDWPTGLVPVLLYESYQYHGMQGQRVCFTLHNLRHQGQVGPEVLWATGLERPEHFFHHDRLRDNHNPRLVNLAKAGIVYSNFVTTVSDQHRWETVSTDQDFGLGHTLWVHRGKYGGVLNGLDYDVWNPEIDPFIARRYGVDSLEDKYQNKRALRERFWLRDGFKPLVAYVGRLDGQKGVDLLRHAIFYTLAHGGQFVLLGPASEPAIEGDFWQLKHELNDNPDCHLELRFDAELSHLIYAGADMLVVPSRYEPCGLVQMIALRYGTVPLVRAIGGLADTVFDKDFSHRPPHERNGFVFEHADHGGVESVLRRALGLWHDYPGEFRELMQRGMRSDYSWRLPAGHYLNIYQHIQNK